MVIQIRFWDENNSGFGNFGISSRPPPYGGLGRFRQREDTKVIREVGTRTAKEDGVQEVRVTTAVKAVTKELQEQVQEEVS